METVDRPIRVTVVQPSLAKYRIPVFQELARRPGIDLRVVYGAIPGLPNVEAKGFEALASTLREVRIAGSLVSVHGAEWSWCSRRDTDVVVLRWSPRSATLLPALLRARANGISTVLWGHGYSKDERGARRGSRRWFAKYASSLVFYDPLTRAAYIEDGWNPEQLFVALNSLDHSEIENARESWLLRPDKLADFRRVNGLESGPIILFVSRLQPANQVDLLIHGTAELAKQFPRIKTVIIGNGSAQRERLKCLADELAVSDNIVCQNGIYDELKLAPWYLCANVFCYPANIGLSLIHALWYGLPVVTSGNLGSQNPEIVALEQGVNGLTYSHGDAASLADALRQIITDPGRRESMSLAARATVIDRFTIPQMVNGLEAAIRYAHNTSVRSSLRS